MNTWVSFRSARSSQGGQISVGANISFYVGHLASLNPDANMVVVANDKGYEPMLEHAKAMGFVVRRQPHGEVKPPAKKAAAKKVAAKKAPAKKVAAKKSATKKAVAKPVAAKKPVAKAPAPSPAAKKASPPKVVPAKKAAAPTPAGAKGVAAGPGKVLAVPASVAPSGTGAVPESLSPKKSVSEADIKRITENLRKVGVNRPTKSAALRRLLKSLLAAETGDALIEVALDRLLAARVISIDAASAVSYPAFHSAGPQGNAPAE